MTNYTYEQRKMIAEFLDTQLPLYKFADDRVGVEWEFIQNKIKALRTVTFGDIKNGVGTKFKFKGCDNVFMIINFDGNASDVWRDAYFVINANLPIFNSNNNVAEYQDDREVEVINETTSD